MGSTAGSSAGNVGLEIDQGRGPSSQWLPDMPEAEVMEHVADGRRQRNVDGERRLTVVIPAYSTAQSEKVSLRVVNEVIVKCCRVRFRPRSADWKDRLDEGV